MVAKNREVVSFAFKHPQSGKVNIPQCSFYDRVMNAVLGKVSERFFFYGGAIRGARLMFACSYSFSLPGCSRGPGGTYFVQISRNLRTQQFLPWKS